MTGGPSLRWSPTSCSFSSLARCPVANAGVILGLFALLALSDDSPAVPQSQYGVPPKGLAMTNRKDVEAYLSAAGLPDVWVRFFTFVAAGESGFSVKAKNDSPGEARAAGIAYKRNAEKLKHCGFAAGAYTFGSGGWFGLLPANAAMNLPKELRCHEPGAIVFVPQLAVPAAVGMARGLMRWPQWQGTVLSLRAGWGWPAKMGDPERLAARRPVYERRAAKLGYPPGYSDTVLPKLTISAAQAYDNIAAAIASGALTS